MSYVKAKQHYQESRPEQDAPQVRTNYRCAAPGCPNAASIDDEWPARPGRCFFHWKAPQSEWARVTREIKADESKRNWGLVPTGVTKTTQEMRARLKDGRPKGMAESLPEDYQ